MINKLSKSFLSLVLLSQIYTTVSQSLISTGELIYTYSHTSPSSLQSYQQTHTADPSVGGSVYDTVFNSNITKIADVRQMPASEIVQSGSYVRPISSRFTHWNSDGSRYMLLKDSTFMDSGNGNTVIMNGMNHTLSMTRGTPLGFIPLHSSAINEWRFDKNVEYNTIMYFISDCKLYSYDIDDDYEPVIIHDFTHDYSDCYSISSGSLGDSSSDSRYWAFMVQTASSSNASPQLSHIITYDKTTDKIIGQLNETSASLLPQPAYVDISPLGTHILIQWSSTGTNDIYDGPHVYDIGFNPATAIRVGDDSSSTNNFAYNNAGRQVVVAHITSNKWSNTPVNTIVSTDIQNGITTTVLYDKDINGFTAAACQWNIGRTYDSKYYGWVHLSSVCIYNPNTINPLQNQLLLLELPASSTTTTSSQQSTRIYIIGYTHNNYNTNINSQNLLYSTISQDMRNIIFGSQWITSKNQWQNTYQINLDSTWLTDLSQRNMPPALGTSAYEPQQSVPYNNTAVALSTPSIGTDGTGTDKTPLQSTANTYVLSTSGILISALLILLS